MSAGPFIHLSAMNRPPLLLQPLVGWFRLGPEEGLFVGGGGGGGGICP